MTKKPNNRKQCRPSISDKWAWLLKLDNNFSASVELCPRLAEIAKHAFRANF